MVYKKSMKGFILAAGSGTRLYSLILEIPKPLLPVGKIPIITYLIDLYLKNMGLTILKLISNARIWKIFIIWKATYFPKEKIELIVERKPSGTFTPIVKKVSPQWFSEPIVVSNSDELKELNLKEMVDWYR